MKYRVWIGKNLLNEEGYLDETIEKETSGGTAENKKTENDTGEKSSEEEKVEPIKLSEHEVITMKISGFSATNVQTTVAQNGSKNDKSANTASANVKKRPDYKITITNRIRSTLSMETLMSSLTSYATSLGMTPTAADVAKGITSMEDKIKDTYKIYGMKDVANIATMAASANLSSLTSFGGDRNKSAENCISIKEWFGMYKEGEIEKTERKSVENGKEDTVTTKKLNPKVYRDVYIEVVLSDIQSFYYHFPNMYIDKFDEEYTDDAGTCKYTIELLGYYHEDKNKTFEHKKVSYTDKVSNGFKKLLDRIGIDVGSLFGGKIKTGTNDDV